MLKTQKLLKKDLLIEYLINAVSLKQKTKIDTLLSIAVSLPHNELSCSTYAVIVGITGKTKMPGTSIYL